MVFIPSYLSERQQRTNVKNAYSTYSDIIWCPTRFYDIDKCDIASYADDNTQYTSNFNLEEVIQKLELTTNNLFEWFKNNHMKANVGKCDLLVTRDTDVTAKITDFDVKNSREEKLLGVKIDSKLSFENNDSSFCKKAIQMHSRES